MNKNDLVTALADMDYCKNQASVVINDIFRVIAESLIEEDKVMIRGFGTFEVKHRKGHMIVDANSKQPKMLDDYKMITFRPSNNLKEAVRTKDANKL